MSWLPLYHDMGLIGTWLSALYFGVPIAILSPLAFLTRPARWLRALHAHRGTISPAPNFAFELCVRRIDDAEIEGLDLSAWRLAFNGSEPVSPDTIERFDAPLRALRLPPRGDVPGLRSRRVVGGADGSADRDADRVSIAWRATRFQAQREAPPAPAERRERRSASSRCGRPLADHEVRIVDAARRPLPERIEGRIEFRGPSVTARILPAPRGHARRPARRLDGFGDLGYVADGELFVTGRQKDMIIKAGRNLYPQEVEEVVGDIPGIRKGCVAAFGIADPAIGDRAPGGRRRDARADPTRARGAPRPRSSTASCRRSAFRPTWS